jgi:hypothetical protein
MKKLPTNVGDDIEGLTGRLESLGNEESLNTELDLQKVDSLAKVIASTT